MKILNIMIAAALVLALPAAALAATYAYVDVSGNVRSHEANNPQEAIATAPSIATHSGVILLDGSGLLGDAEDEDTSNDEDDDEESEAASDLRSDMRALLSEHVEYSIEALREIEEADGDDSDMLDEAIDRQMENAEELGGAIGSVYGDDAEDDFVEMFKEHIVASNDYTRALVDDDEEAAEEALDELVEYLEEISAFLAGANPEIDESTLLDALTDHEELLNLSSEAYIEGDEDESEELEDRAIEQIRDAADYLVDAIIEQFPDKF